MTSHKHFTLPLLSRVAEAFDDRKQAHRQPRAYRSYHGSGLEAKDSILITFFMTRLE